MNDLKGQHERRLLREDTLAALRTLLLPVSLRNGPQTHSRLVVDNLRCAWVGCLSIECRD